MQVEFAGGALRCGDYVTLRKVGDATQKVSCVTLYFGYIEAGSFYLVNSVPSLVPFVGWLVWYTADCPRRTLMRGLLQDSRLFVFTVLFVVAVYTTFLRAS